MRVSAWTTLLKASSRAHPQACRVIAGRRLVPRRRLHTSIARRREDDFTHTTSHQVIEAPYNGSIAEEVPLEIENGADGGPEKPPRPKDKSNYGSAARRAGRNIKRVKELPPVHIPPWFLDRNIVLQNSVKLSSDGEVSQSASPPIQNEEAATVATNSENQGSKGEGLGEPLPNTSPDSDYKTTRTADSLDIRTWREIYYLTKAGLHVPSWERADITASHRPHFLMNCPRDGASRFLCSVIRSLAKVNGTDFLRLSPQDIAEIGGDYLEDPSNFRPNTMSTLGYDTSLLATVRQSPASDDIGEEEEDFEGEDEEEDVEDGGFKPMPFRSTGGTALGGAIHIGTFGGNLQDVFKNLMPAGGPPQPSKPMMIRPAQQQLKDMTPELKMGLLVETLLNTPEIKRVASSATKEAENGSQSPKASEVDNVEDNAEGKESSEITPSSERERGSNALTVLISDYSQINSTMNGTKFLDKLHEVVEARRKEGQRILVVGINSHKDLMRSPFKFSVKEMQDHPTIEPMRTIVTPVTEEGSDISFEKEQKLRIKARNLRHFRDMVRRIAPNFSQVAQLVTNWKLEIDSQIAFLSGLDESMWTFERVQRIATTALGILEDSEKMNSGHLEAALGLIGSSDSAKVEWVQKQKEERKKKPIVVPGTETSDDSKERIRKLRKTCNDYEKKLLNGVVHPEDIRTTFADVQAPPTTIDALKTLTSLSLVRPDAFKYGVLATDRIPGLLLYGPPGTGKTLLARAVAKESGATVLEVSGSDVYDMYVGEGEKNVRAIFSLAKKLTPCIVFIDEADAILGARSGGGNRTSHRELINQFLREWDGMTELSAFIMVATNRPFDLDEACLRRLPRRLLVDLPVEKDREAILKIHLKDELLDPEVSLAKLASETPFYSGSDLKNVAVAAALTCVREEFETAAAHARESTGGAKYQYAEKRTLHPRHFTKAMEEISASISEDMGSLSAIRKFDEKYGDRRGRRKKGGYGFKTVTDSEKQGSDAARVRNQT